MKNLFLIAALVMVVGCSEPQQKAVSDASSTGPTQVSLAYSEYPSWSTFGVAESKALIDGAAGKQGPLEKLYNVDIVLKLVDYDACINLYGSGVVDAVCITNMDILSPSLGRPSVVVLPTSTSVGADACITVNPKSGDDLDSLKGQTTYMLEKSVSQFVFTKCLEKAGRNPADYPIKNLDPAAAATALQNGQKSVTNIMVWNPFVLQTLRTNDKARVLFDSSTIPEEVIDCVVVGRDFLQKEGSDRAVLAILASYYEVSKLLADPIQREGTLVALGEKFCSLPAADMAKCCEQTRFYSTPEKARTLLESKTFQANTMPGVLEFCVKNGIVPPLEKETGLPRFGFEEDKALVNFTTKYIKQYQAEAARAEAKK